jgi:signal peptidase I
VSTSVLILAVVLLALVRGWFMAFPRTAVRSIILKAVLLAILGVIAGFAIYTAPADGLSPPLHIAPVIVVLALFTIFTLPGGILDEERKKSVIELLDTLVIAGFTALLLIGFVVRPFFIPSGSMEQTLQINDMVLVDELAYRFWSPARDDIIVFRPPEEANMGDKDLIKRVVAVGGDTLEIKDNALYINNQRQEEPFIYRDSPMGLGMGDFGPVTIPPGNVFCMGDHRSNSDDSRYWGTLPVKNIIGKAFFIFWPPTRIGRIR